MINERSRRSTAARNRAPLNGWLLVLVPFALILIVVMMTPTRPTLSSDGQQMTPSFGHAVAEPKNVDIDHSAVVHVSTHVGQVIRLNTKWPLDWKLAGPPATSVVLFRPGERYATYTTVPGLIPHAEGSATIELKREDGSGRVSIEVNVGPE